MAKERSSLLLRLIAVLKLVKAFALLLSLATLFNLIRQDDPAHTIVSWALTLHVDPQNHYLRSLLAALLNLNPRHFALLTMGTVLYALLFSVEGIGLWYAKLWAEYLTIVATAGFIPIEVYEMLKELSATKTVVLALNVAIVAYLIIQVRGRRIASVS
jgi:uncharacterized membrane protein (DUF2068 family)